MITEAACYIQRKIKCPKHFVLKPGHDPYIREINPLYRKLPKWAFKKFGISAERIKTDKHGKPLVNYTNFYQPEVSANYAVEFIYDPVNPICKRQCQGRCLKGLGKINTNTIKRLSGGKMK